MDPSPPSRPPTVLVVEDDLPVLRMAETILRGPGHRVLGARSAEEAEELLAAEAVDLVFTDVVLPGASGLELARRLAADRPELALLVTTGQRTRDVEADLLEGDFRFLAKPYTNRDLLAAVDELLAGRTDGRPAP